MKTQRSTLARNRAWMSTIALVAAMHLGGSALAQANSRPPERLTYQGFIAGSDGVALGNAAPKNYDVVFRVFDSEGSNTPLWGEQQTVTLDKGYFSVLLGEGAAVSGIPNAGIALSSLFNSATASERWVSFTVKGIGSGGADAEILPRVRMMSVPYSFLANRALSAGAADKVVQSNGADLLAASGDQLSVGGNLLINQGKYLMLGVGTPNKEASAGMISYRFHTPDSLEILGAGAQGSGSRKITFFSEGGATFQGPVGVNGAVNASSLSATEVSGANVRANTFWGDSLILGKDRPKQFPFNGSIIYATGLLPNGEDTLLIQGGGNVTATRTVQMYADGGFNLAGPSFMNGTMSVNGQVQIRGNSALNLGSDVAKGDANGTLQYQRYSTGIDIVGAGTAISNRKIQFHSAESDFTGRLSVGVVNAQYPFTVHGQSYDGFGAFFQYKVACLSLYQFSDARAKDVVGISDASRDLGTLRRLRVTDYRMKDRGSEDGPMSKGVLAQELREVLPHAVSTNANVIPNIRKDSRAVDWAGPGKPVRVQVDGPHGIQAGDRLSVEVDGQQRMVTALAVPDDVSFTYEGGTECPKKVRVIGREVKDFLTVDYQQLYMTAVSALQEVDRQVQGLNKQVVRMAELERKAARVDAMERDIAELRKLVAAMAAPAKGKESAAAGTSRDAGAIADAR